MKVTFLVASLALSCRVYGRNDWSNACLKGTCSYDIEESPTSMGGTIKISVRFSFRISDITSAAGWQILNCTDSTNNQTILLACTDESMGCGHLFQESAQDTVVRLPNECGSGPFVRVAKHWIPENQSLWSDITSNMTKRNGTIPTVHMLQIDDNFEQSSGLHGNVSFEVLAQGSLGASAVSERRKRFSSTVSEHQTVTVSNSSLLFNDILTCPDGDGGMVIEGLNGDLDEFQATFAFTITMVSQGTIIPPAITSLEFSAPTNASISGTLFFIAFLQGVVNPKNVELANIGLPGLAVEGIITVGPTFSILADLAGEVQLQTNFETEIEIFFEIINLQFTFPSNSPPSSVTVLTPNVPISVSVSPNENASVQYGFRIVPVLLVGIEAFGQSGDVSVSYDVGYNVDMNATPSSGNAVEACTTIMNTVSLTVASSGGSISAISQAEPIIIFDETNSILSFCETVPLGPSPSISRRESSSLYKRDSVSCPPPAATPLNGIVFTGQSLP